MDNSFAFQVTLTDPFDQAVEKVTQALKDEGFGVLTKVDVKSTLKDKLDLDFSNYVILGACNPPLAHKALVSEPLIGLLLPCNVTVREIEGGAEVAIINPATMLEMGLLQENEGIRQVAEDAGIRLANVAAQLEG